MTGTARLERVAASLAIAVAIGLAGEPARATVLVVEAERLHTVAGPMLRDAVVVIEDGRVARVGPADRTRVPEGARVVAARVVTPGLIDAQTSIGLAGLYNVDADRDQDEDTDPNWAQLRALDSFNPSEPLLRYLLEHGVTLVQASPGPVNPIAGQAGVFRTHGTLADRMRVRSPSALVFNLGEQPKAAYGKDRKTPTTRMGTAALIRQALNDGLEYARKREGKGRKGDDDDAPERDLRLETLARVARGELRALFTAHRADDIVTALRIRREFDLDAALAGATEGYLVAGAIREAGVPVLVGPVMERVGRPETENATFENAAILSRQGVPIAIRSGFESYVPKARVVLFEAAVAAANGLHPARALRAITLDAAKILGVAADYGSLEEGKVADLVLFDGDPFEYTSHVESVIAAGEIVYTRKR